MNFRMINLLEAIKTKTYTTYTDFLENADVEKITRWFSAAASEKLCEFEKAIDLMYELYIREDIDFCPYEEYTRIASCLSEKYEFDVNDFLNLYHQFRMMVFEG